MLALRKATADFGADLVHVDAPTTPGAGRVTVTVAGGRANL